uniref:ATP synthase F0 subunit 6 n=1 Tax=Raeta sp. TaxID=3067663 RepID=A0AA49X6G9_9BIVA|nr:ATP synthase F0 subunit 6 [Raeta sp.]
MALDIFSFSDFWLGGANSIQEVSSFLAVVTFFIFPTAFSTFWMAGCRQSALVMLLCHLVKSTIVSGGKMETVPGGVQFVSGQFITVFSLCGLSSVVYSYPVVTNFWLVLAVSFPFWLSSVIHLFSSQSWNMMTSKLTHSGFLSSSAYAGLESMTILLRVLTLGLRIFLNLMIGLVLVKLAMSLGSLSSLLDKGPVFFEGSFKGMNFLFLMVGSVFYCWDWAVACLQTWLFVFLSTSYFNESESSMKSQIRKSDRVFEL